MDQEEREGEKKKRQADKKPGVKACPFAIRQHIHGPGSLSPLHTHTSRFTLASFRIKFHMNYREQVLNR